nr:DNA repair protein RecO [uncultured Mediterraneibacter sp.]
MNQIVLTGMVLSTMPIGEYDRRVVILTKEQGKISAFARGARRPNSPLVGAVNPFCFGQFTVYAGRTSYTIQSVSISNYFAELREDMTGAYYGFYFLEFADYYTKESNDEREMLKLLYQTLRALINPHIPDRLVRYIFELKALTVNGQAPQVFQCLSCGASDRPVVFSPAKGGLVCRECDGGVIDGMILDNSTLYSMQYIESSPIEKLYTFNVTEKVLDELGKVLGRLMEVHVDRRFKSLEILETLEK